VSFAAITLCVASQRVFIVVSVYFVIDSVRKLLDTPSYICSDDYWPKFKGDMLNFCVSLRRCGRKQLFVQAHSEPLRFVKKVSHS